ncbi:biotin transporter BioY [Micromonospora sp. NPDC051925]|uniref:biotin transporter BioY n=1 Tax=Micromonospora sp. NPDC051925 TaxID=3364288 RepID=UPI0037C9FD62
MAATRSASTQNTVLVAVFAAIIAALGIVPPITVGVLPVPITLQTLGVMLAGALLGAWRGMLSALVFVVLAVAGLPILAGGRGGFGVFLGPTGGYLVGFIFGAFVVGLLVQRWAIKRENIVLRHLCVGASTIVGGIGVVYAFGIPWTSLSAGLSLGTSLSGSLVFLPGDLLKATVATLVAVRIHGSYSRLLDA